MSDSDLNNLAKQHFLCALKLMNREKKKKIIASFGNTSLAEKKAKGIKITVSHIKRKEPLMQTNK